MKFFRLDLLTLLISLFIFNSCKNQDTVGLGIASAGQLNGSLVDTSTIFTHTVSEDSIVTSGLAKNPLALFNDPIFGTTEANLATDLNLPESSAYTLPTGKITIDSVRLILQFADGFYGDSLSSNYTVNVYQLDTKHKFNKNLTYYNTKDWGAYTGAPLLGSLNFNARTHDSVKITSVITGAPDTAIKVAPQIRIPIDPNFINNNLFGASSTVLSSNSIFNNTVRGLYITIDKTKSTGAGGIFLIKPNDSVAVYYKTFNGTAIDTTVLYLPVTNFAAQIKHTYTTTIQAELSDTTTSSGTIYLQGLAGLRARVKFPSLLLNLRNSLLKKDSDIVLNRAELVITPSGGTDRPYSPLPKLTMYRLDIARQPAFLEDAAAGVDARAQGRLVFGGFYSANTKAYHFIVTAYMQDLLLKKTVDYGTYIAPVDTTNKTTIDIAPTPQVAARTVAGGGANKSSPYRIKLNIIYTKIGK